MAVGETDLRIVELTERVKNTENQVQDLKEKLEIITKLENKITKLSVQIDTITAKIGVLEKSVNEVINKPAKRWDMLITTVCTSLLSGIIGIVLGFVFSGVGG